MTKWIKAFVIMLVVIMPFVALCAKRSAEAETRAPAPVIVRTEPVVHKAESEPERLPEFTIEQTIEAINAGYVQMWEEQGVTRYAISDTERREIERIVASEGGYCDYEFQALVAECILNGCEADDLRPLELFARGDLWLTHNIDPTETTKQAVSDVFDYGIFPTEEKVRYYYNPDYCESPMHESFCYVLTCEGCRFFKDWEGKS